MTRSKRLAPLIKMAREGETRAARAMAEARRQLEDQQRRLSDLKAYHRDYQKRIGTAGRNGINAGDLNRYKTFLTRLDGVIALQAQQVERMAAHYAAMRTLWTEARARYRSLETAAERYRREELRADDRREQQQSDDHTPSRPTAAHDRALEYDED